MKDDCFRGLIVHSPHLCFIHQHVPFVITYVKFLWNNMGQGVYPWTACPDTHPGEWDNLELLESRGFLDVLLTRLLLFSFLNPFSEYIFFDLTHTKKHLGFALVWMQFIGLRQADTQGWNRTRQSVPLELHVALTVEVQLLSWLARGLWHNPYSQKQWVSESLWGQY